MGTRTYFSYENDEGDVVPRDEATWKTTSVYEVIDPDGTESLVDEWCIPINRMHDPDPVVAAMDAADAAYHERKEMG